MPSLVTTLGLTASSTTTHAPTIASLNFILAYFLLTPRFMKRYHGLEHYKSPRDSVAKFGGAAVTSGKVTQRQLERIGRNEAAQANAVENYALLVGALGFATVAGVEPGYVNCVGVVYTVLRVVYAVVYVWVEHPVWCYSRGVIWWAANGACLWLLSRAGTKLNEVV